MANFPPLGSAPYGSKAPFPSDDANQASEQMTQTVNAADGSSHAPTGLIEWSGAFGGGFKFDSTDPFIFRGKLNVTSGLTVTAPSSGTWVFDEPVVVSVLGNMAIGASSVVAWTNGSTVTGAIDWQALVNLSGATAAEFAFSTSNPVPFHGKLDVDDNLMFTGSGSVSIDVGTTFVLLGNGVIDGASVIAFGNGATLTGGTIDWQADVDLSGDTTFTSGTKPKLDPARTWHRRGFRVARTTYLDPDTDSPQAVDDFKSPLFDAPVLIILEGSPDPVETVFEIFPPPDGGTAVSVTIKSVIPHNPGATFTPAQYQLVRWGDGLVADEVVMSDPEDDTHNPDASDWSAVLTTTVTVNANATIDLQYRYGLKVISGYIGSGDRISLALDIKLSGTTAAIAGT